MGSGALPTGPMPMCPQAGPGPRGPMGSGSLGVGAMNNSLLPGGMGVSTFFSDHIWYVLHDARACFLLPYIVVGRQHVCMTWWPG